MVGSLPPRFYDAAFRGAGPVLPSRPRIRTPGTKMQKVASVLGARDPADMHLRLASHCQDPGALVLGGHEPPTILSSPQLWPALTDPVALMMFLDTESYLPDDILVKVGTGPRWGSAWRHGCRIWTTESPPGPGGWRRTCGSVRRRESGCCAVCSTATCPSRWSSGPRWASVHRSATGCGARCDRGPRTCWPRPGSPGRATCSRRRSGGSGPSTSRGAGTASTSCGTCSCSRCGSDEPRGVPSATASR